MREGMRGTEQLADEQKPRSRKRTRREQPYRRKRRRPGSALDAMLKGGPGFLPNPQDLRRLAQRKAAEKAKQEKRRGR